MPLSVTTRPRGVPDAQSESLWSSGLEAIPPVPPVLLSLLPISCTEHPVLDLVLLEEAKMNKVTDFKKLIDCLSRMLASFFTS